MAFSVEPSPFASIDDAMDQVQTLAMRCAQRLDPVRPFAGGLLSGSAATGTPVVRWHAALPPLAPGGPIICFRRQRVGEFALSDFAGGEQVRERLEVALAGSGALVVVGPTASGKSSLVGALLRTYCMGERVAVLESVVELPILSPLWMQLTEASPDLEGRGAIDATRLLSEVLRLTPDRLVLGELRGGREEGRAFLDAMASGHRCTLATMHGGTVDEGRQRLGLMVRDWTHQLHGLVTWVVMARPSLQSGGRPRICEVVSC